MASLEVDLGKIDPGQTVTVKWRGKPVFIRRRTEHEQEMANDVDLSQLRDPEPDSARAQKPEVVGSCEPWTGRLGQNTHRPQTTSSAGSRVTITR